MSATELLQRAWRQIEIRVPSPASGLRKLLWRLRGAQIGRRTRLPNCRVVWPHQVRIGDDCRLQPGIFFNYDHYWTPGPSIILGDRVLVAHDVEFNIQGRIEIAEDCLIGAGCVFVDHDHGSDPRFPVNGQPNEICPIRLGKNAWLGAGCIVLKGVSIGEASVVGAGSVVTKSIPPGEIWAGNPARRIRTREDCGCPPSEG